MRQLVELQKVHPNLGPSDERAQHLGDEPPRRPHLLDFGRGPPYSITLRFCRNTQTRERSGLTTIPRTRAQSVPQVNSHMADAAAVGLYPTVAPGLFTFRTWHARHAQRQHPTQRGMLTQNATRGTGASRGS